MSKARELSKLPNYVLSTVAELKLAVGKEQGDKAFVGGYYADGDGGGGDFYWDTISVEADNGGTILQVTGTTTGRWKRIHSGSVNVKWFGAKGDGITDDTVAIQNTYNITANEVVGYGNFVCTNYINISNKTSFSTAIFGSVIPIGILNNVNTGLFNLSNCIDTHISIDIKNPNYASTLNCIRLASCSNINIFNCDIDVKYVGFDGSAGILIGNSCSNINIYKNKIRTGYGVLGNDGTSISDINIYENEFIGQKFYGSLGTGDAIEANFPIQGSTNWYVKNNTFHGYEAYHIGLGDARHIIIGMANVSGFDISGNTFYDSQSEAVHLEDGTSNGSVTRNKIYSGIQGVNLQINSVRDLKNIVIDDNIITLSDTFTFPLDYGAAILLNTNTTSTGIAKDITITNNICTGGADSDRGICIHSVDGFIVSGNTVRGFQRVGYDIRRFGGIVGTPTNGKVFGNTAIANGWNFRLGADVGSDALLNVYFDETNIASGSLFSLDYVSLISTRTGTTVRIPFAHGKTKRTLSAGDIVVNPDGKESIVSVAGAATVYKVSDGVMEFSKEGTGNSNTITILYNSFATYSIPSIVEIYATGVAANSTNFECKVARFAVRHVTSVGTITAFGTDDLLGAITITPSISGLNAIFTVAFTGAYSHTIHARIIQQNIHDNTLGGIVSIS